MKQLGFQNIRVETYAKYVAMSLSSNKHDRSEYGSIIRECSSILSNEEGFSVHVVRSNVLKTRPMTESEKLSIHSSLVEPWLN